MSSPAATTEVAVKTISTPEVRQLLDSKRSFQFWNVLTDEWFKGENIAGSRRVPLDKVGNEVRTTNLPRNVEIVVYCGGPKCPQSRMAAEKLAKLGYENVRAYEGGLEAVEGRGTGRSKRSNRFSAQRAWFAPGPLTVFAIQVRRKRSTRFLEETHEQRFESALGTYSPTSRGWQRVLSARRAKGFRLRFSRGRRSVRRNGSAGARSDQRTGGAG